ncbi:MAG: ABC transporter permease [Candidatus Sulfotelmatobacter sp.]
MTLRDLVVDVVRTLWAHKLRAFLTMFGIAWGIVSIVLMVAAGEGLRKGQEEQSRTLGKDVMIAFHGRTSLQAGGMHAGRLVRWEDPDVPVVQAEARDCEYTIPELEQETVPIHSNFSNATLEVAGSYPQFSEIRSLNVGWDASMTGATCGRRDASRFSDRTRRSSCFRDANRWARTFT